MDELLPRSADELAEALAAAGGRKRAVRLGGAFSKDRMAGPLAPADTVISTSAMNRILQYEPHDLTISVESGMRWADLTDALAANMQVIPLDPPFFDTATVGGVVAANTSGPRRRGYGSARDVVIGMKFATLEGKIVQSGGMVVKNVAGLDMAKLMIGSFGTLAAIGIVNFKLAPAPPATRTFALRFSSLDDAIAARDHILGGVLQPTAIDLVNPAAGARIGVDGTLSDWPVHRAVGRGRHRRIPPTPEPDGREQRQSQPKTRRVHGGDQGLRMVDGFGFPGEPRQRPG